MTNVEKKLPIKDFKEIRSGTVQVSVKSGESTKILVKFDPPLSKIPDIILLSPEVYGSIGKVYFESYTWSKESFEIIATCTATGNNQFTVHYLAIVV